MRKIGAKVPSFSHYAQSCEQLLCKQRVILCQLTVEKRRNFFQKTLYKMKVLYYNKKAHFQKTNTLL